MISDWWLNLGLGRKWPRDKSKRQQQRFDKGCSRKISLGTKLFILLAGELTRYQTVLSPIGCLDSFSWNKLQGQRDMPVGWG